MMVTSTLTLPEPISCPLLLTRDEVAATLQVPAETIDNLHRTGQLRAWKIGKHLRWRPADVRAFVEKLGDDAGAEICRA